MAFLVSRLILLAGKRIVHDNTTVRKAMDNSFASIINTMLSMGVESIPIIAVVLLVLVLYFYRRDHSEWRQQSRDDLRDSIQAINKNTSALEKVALLVQLRMENHK